MGWYTRGHFGERVIAAVREHYSLHEEIDGFFVYVPRSAG
jgi:hypothetical protein